MLAPVELVELDRKRRWVVVQEVAAASSLAARPSVAVGVAQGLEEAGSKPTAEGLLGEAVEDPQ